MEDEEEFEEEDDSDDEAAAAAAAAGRKRTGGLRIAGWTQRLSRASSALISLPAS